MIKNYLQLNDTEKQNAYDFSTRYEFTIFDNEMTNELYDHGNGSLFYIYKDKIIAKTHIILKDTIYTSTSYIVGIDLIDISNSSINIIIKLILKAYEISRSYGAKEVYFGTNSEDIVGILQNYNIRHEHLSLVMKLNDNSQIANILKIRELNYSNREVYKMLYNNIFKSIPHGGLISESKLEENIRDSSLMNGHYIVSDELCNDIGIIDTKVINNIGTFDIGILNEFRNKGYGKKILDTAIHILKNNNSVKEINLTVISKNSKAYDMYMNRGFVHKKIYSFWYDAANFIKFNDSSAI